MSNNLLAELENRSEIDVPVEHPDTIVVRRYKLSEKSLENHLKKKARAIGVCQEVHLVDELLNLVVTESPRLFQAPQDWMNAKIDPADVKTRYWKGNSDTDVVSEKLERLAVVGRLTDAVLAEAAVLADQEQRERERFQFHQLRRRLIDAVTYDEVTMQELRVTHSGLTQSSPKFECTDPHPVQVKMVEYVTEGELCPEDIKAMFRELENEAI
jgi:hypothetical protein